MVTGCHARQESDPSETTGSLKQTAWIFFSLPLFLSLFQSESDFCLWTVYNNVGLF